MTLDLLKPTVARTSALLKGKTRHGTGFLVSRRLLLTCAHCVGDQADWAKKVDLVFTNWKDDRERTATVVDAPYWDLDVCLLQLDKDAPVDPLLRHPTAKVDDGWYSWGHPAQVAEDGIKFDGEVADPSAKHFNREVMQLDCNQAADSVRGASGSPVVVDGQIVGLLTNQLLQNVQTAAGPVQKPAFGTLFALPMTLVAKQAGLEWLLDDQVRLVAENIVAGASRQAEKATAKQIATEQNYIATRYVERKAAATAFESFLAQDAKTCFLVVGKAGSGKTTIVSHLAQNTGGPTLFFRGGVDAYSVDAVRKRAEETLIDPKAVSGTAPRNWDELMRALKLVGRPLVLFIDAINEAPFDDIQARRDDLRLLLEFIEPLPIRLVVSCRDVFWTYFTDNRGQGFDFWWAYVYDPTYDVRVDQELQRRKTAEQQVAVSASQQSVEIAAADDKQLEQVRQQVAKSVERLPSLLLGDFTAEETATALGRYKVEASDALHQELRHPLFLRLYSEIADGAVGAEEPLTVREVMARYLTLKIASVQNALLAYDTKGTEGFLSRLTQAMRSQHYGRLSKEALDAILGNDQNMSAIRARLLDEGVILEYKADHQVGFQFDSLFEYMLSRDVTRQINEVIADDDQIRRLGKELIEEAGSFESLAGALEFACAELERQRPAACNVLLRSFVEASTLGRTTFLRAWAHLKTPLNEERSQLLFDALGDIAVDDDIAAQSLAHVVEHDAGHCIAIARAAVEDDNDVALGRCATVIASAESIPARDLVAFAAVLLESPSATVALKVTTSLATEMGIFSHDRAGRDSWRIGHSDLGPLLEAANQGKISFAGLLAVMNGILAEMVNDLPPGALRTYIAKAAARSEVNPVLGAGAFGPMILALVKAESLEVLALADVVVQRQDRSYLVAALLLLAISVHPGETEWLVGVLAQEALRLPGYGKRVFPLLVSPVASNPGILERIERSLPPTEAIRLRLELGKVGYAGGKWTNAASLHLGVVTGAVLTSLTGLYAAESLFAWQMALPTPETITLLLAVVVTAIGSTVLISSGVITLFLPLTLLQRTVLALMLVAATGFVVTFHSHWVLIAVLACGGIATVIACFKPGFSATAIKTLLFIIVGSGAGALAVSAPVLWLVPGLGWLLAVALVAAVYSAAHVATMGRLISVAITATISAILFGIACTFFGVHTSGSTVEIILLLMSAFLLPMVLFLSLSDYKQGHLRGFAGKPLVIVGIAALCAILVLAMFSLWAWVLALAVLFGSLLLPTTADRWLTTRAGPVLMMVLAAALAGLLVAHTWSPVDGVVYLFITTAWWSTVLLLLVGVVLPELTGQYQLRQMRITEGGSERG